MNRWWMLLGLGLSGVALAQDGGAELSYEAALQAAMQANPDLVKSTYAVDQAKGSLVQSNGMYDPSLTIEGNVDIASGTVLFGPTKYPNDQTSLGATATIAGDLPTGTSYTLRGQYNQADADFAADQYQDTRTPGLYMELRQDLLKGISPNYNQEQVVLARRSYTIAELQLEQSRQTVLASTARAYFTWIGQERLNAIAEESVVTSEEALRVEELKAAAGEVAPVDRTRLEAQLVQDRSSAIDNRKLADDAADELALLMGQMPGTVWSVEARPTEVQELDIDPAQAVDIALQRNIELQVARIEVERSELQYKNTKHAVLPTLQAGLTYQLRNQTVIDQTGKEVGQNTNLGVSAIFSVPLGHRAALGDRRRAEASFYTERTNLESLERSIASQVRTQVRVLNAARAKVELQDINLKLAEETLTAEEAKLRVGRAIVKDVLDDRNALETAKNDAVKSRWDYFVARVELRRLQGTLDTAL